MKIYLTRHGQTEWNTQGRIQGWGNSDLTEKGMENAKRLGKSLKDIEFDCIYTSPLGRAVQTANCIKGEKNIKVKFLDLLKEMSFGDWEGIRHSEIEQLYPEVQYAFRYSPEKYQPSGGETFQELLLRAKKALEYLAGHQNYKNILVVSHAMFIKAFLTVIKNIPIEDFWGPPVINDTCLTILEVKDGRIDIILEADTSHLCES